MARWAAGLARQVADRWIVDHVSLDVQAGEVLAIVGPSGAGKSSFLRLLNRLDEPSEGTVYPGEQDYKTIPPRDQRRRVGIVLQTEASRRVAWPGTPGGSTRGTADTFGK